MSRSDKKMGGADDLMGMKRHWEEIYRSKSPDAVSWYQAYPAVSMQLIENSCMGKAQPILDVGGGASLLPKCLLEAGYRDISVLDLSSKAIELSKAQLGELANEITWYECDVQDFVAERRFTLWHDRAVFHFLTDSASQQRYVDSVRRAMADDGHAIIATFAVDGPKRCSGLPVKRHDAASMQSILGEQFQLIETVREMHVTPARDEQAFEYFRLRRRNIAKVQ